MKKLLLITILTSFLSISYSQKIGNIVSDTANLTTSKIYSDIKIGINSLAQSLKVSATHVYNTIIKQQIVHSITNTIIILMLFLLCLIVAKYAKTTYKGHLELCKLKNNPITTSTPKEVLSIILTIISVLLGIIGTITLFKRIDDIIIGFINPEYGAIKEIISFIKK